MNPTKPAAYKFQPFADRNSNGHASVERIEWPPSPVNQEFIVEAAGQPPVIDEPDSESRFAAMVARRDPGHTVLEERPTSLGAEIRRRADSGVERAPVVVPEDEPVELAETESSDPTGDSGRVLVVDRSGQLSATLGKAVAGLFPEPEVFRLDRSTLMVEAVEEQDPDVLVVAADDLTQASMRRVAQIHRAHPKIVILLGDNKKSWTPAQMAASGASDILPANPSKARLRARLEVAIQTSQELRSQHTVFTERIVVQDAPAPSAADKEPVRTQLGEVFTVTSATGGSGKTFVAANLATYLVKATGAKVLLIDLDLQFGEIHAALHLHPKHTIAELVKEEGDLDAVLADHLVEHKCGFKALCAPNDPLAGEWIGPNEVTRVLDAARKRFDYIVVDSPPTLSETCLAAFDQSEALVITANMDVPSLKNMRRFLETLEMLKVPTAQVFLLLNRADTGTGIELPEVEPLFPQGFMTVLPSAREVCWSVNMGVPLIHDAPESEISRQLALGFMKIVPPAAGVTLPWDRRAPQRGVFRRKAKSA